ncbi:hypothetical protein LSTR_LSTR000047, partial [Laodelphax striatellus]
RRSTFPSVYRACHRRRKVLKKKNSGWDGEGRRQSDVIDERASLSRLEAASSDAKISSRSFRRCPLFLCGGWGTRAGAGSLEPLGRSVTSQQSAALPCRVCQWSFERADCWFAPYTVLDTRVCGVKFILVPFDIFKYSVFWILPPCVNGDNTHPYTEVITLTDILRPPCVEGTSQQLRIIVSAPAYIPIIINNTRIGIAPLSNICVTIIPLSSTTFLVIVVNMHADAVADFLEQNNVVQAFQFQFDNTQKQEKTTIQNKKHLLNLQNKTRELNNIVVFRK